MNENFDPFAGIEPEEKPEYSDVLFGEIVIYRGYRGARVDGEKGIVEYDPNNPPAKVKAGPSTAWEFKHFPIDVKFETFVMQDFEWGDAWKCFEASMAELHNLNIAEKETYTAANGKEKERPTSAAALARKTLYNIHMRSLASGSHFFQYETPIVRTYKKSDGSEGKIRGIKVLKQYADMEACQAAKAANDGAIPEGSKLKKEERKVEALELEQAIGFVETLARQSQGTNGEVSLEKLGDAFLSMPMLANLSIDLPEVQEIVKRIEAEPAF